MFGGQNNDIAVKNANSGVAKANSGAGAKDYLSDKFALGSFDEETGNMKRYFDLSPWHYLIILGVAVSGMAALINTYNAVSGFNDKVKGCTQTKSVKSAINTKFIILLVISIFIVIFGFVLAWFLRGQDNQRRLLTLGLMTAGIFGILYSLSIKFDDVSNNFKLWASWIVFLGFILLGFFLSTRDDVRLIAPIDWR